MIDRRTRATVCHVTVVTNTKVQTIVSLKFNSVDTEEAASCTDKSQLMGSKRNNREPYQPHDVMFTGF